MSYITTSLVIGFLALDTTVAFQVLVSQPLFACPILGWFLGDLEMGFEIGLLMQLLWLSSIPVGASKFPEGNMASMVTCAIAIYFKNLGYPNAILTIAFVVGIVISYIGAMLTVMDRKINGYVLNFILKAAEQAKLYKISFLEITSVFAYYVLMSALAFLALIVADWIIPEFIDLLPSSLEMKLFFVKPVIFGIGVALTVPMIYQSIRHQH